MTDDGRPPHHHVGQGDDPLGRVEPGLSKGDADDCSAPHDAQHGDPGPAAQGDPGHGRVRPGDGDVDGRVIDPPHPASAGGGPRMPVEEGAHPEQRGDGNGIDGEDQTGAHCRGHGHQDGARHQGHEERDSCSTPRIRGLTGSVSVAEPSAPGSDQCRRRRSCRDLAPSPRPERRPRRTGAGSVDPPSPPGPGGPRRTGRRRG